MSLESRTPHKNMTKWRIIWAIAAVSPFLMFPIRELAFGDTSLLSEIGIHGNLTAIAIGCLYFVIIYVLRPPPADRAVFKQKITVFQALSLIGCCAFLFPYLFRFGIELVAFRNYTTPVVIKNAVIVGHLRRRAFRPIRLIVQVPGNLREVGIYVEDELGAQYRHVSSSGKDCIRLRTETGLGGYMRALGSNNPSGLYSTNDLVPGCSSPIDATAISR